MSAELPEGPLTLYALTLYARDKGRRPCFVTGYISAQSRRDAESWAEEEVRRRLPAAEGYDHHATAAEAVPHSLVLLVARTLLETVQAATDPKDSQ